MIGRFFLSVVEVLGVKRPIFVQYISSLIVPFILWIREENVKTEKSDPIKPSLTLLYYVVTLSRTEGKSVYFWYCSVFQ